MPYSSLEKRRENYQKVKEQKRKTNKEYFSKHPEQVQKRKERCQLWYKNNKKKHKEYIKEREKHNPGITKRENKKACLKKNYGLTLDWYNKQFELQNGCCAICGKNRLSLSRDLAVDHNHVTNKIRGLLCGDCNRGLGYFKSDLNGIKLLLKSIEYLKSYDYDLLENGK